MNITWLVIALTITTSALAADNELTEKEKADGWILLFDGKTLNGWMTSSQQPSKTPVEDGAINPHKCGGYMMVHEKMWEDFILSLDFKISKGCNSGIFVRTYSLTPRPGKDVGFNGIEIAIDDTTSAGYHDTSAIYDLVKPMKNAMKPAGEWNHVEIACNKNIVVVVLNGEKVTRMDLDEFKEQYKRPDGTPHKFDIAFKDHPRKGYIGFQDHGSPCWFKNVKLKPLGAGAVDATSVEGAWQGTLDVPGAKLRLVLKISKKPDGALTAKLDSLDQGAMDIPVDEVTFKDGVLRFEIKRLMVTYEGKLSGAEIVGQFKQGGFTLPLTLKKTDKPAEAKRPQEPKKPYPYVEEEVIYENKKAGVKLAGTLTLPQGKGPFPATLLITGSGAQDRNETVFAHKPFWILADHLTRKGIAVLRVDDRGVGGSTGNVSQATSEDFAEDVLAGVAYLKSRKEIDRKKIGLIGHSEGGIIAPMAAVKSKEVAFIVLMAGTGLTGEEILYLQGELITRAAGAHILDVAAQRRVQEQMFAVVLSETDNARAERKLREILAEEVSKLSEEEKKAAGSASTAMEAQVKQVLSPWFRYFLTYDPKPTLMKVKCPVLAINGEKDLQVPPKENLRAIEDALKAGRNKDYTVKELPGLNHLFQTCKTGSPSEYSQIEETIAPVALETMAEWILKRTKKR